MAIKSVPPPLALLFRTRLMPRPLMIPLKNRNQQDVPCDGNHSSTRMDTVNRLTQDRMVNFFPTRR